MATKTIFRFLVDILFLFFNAAMQVLVDYHLNQSHFDQEFGE